VAALLAAIRARACPQEADRCHRTPCSFTRRAAGKRRSVCLDCVDHGSVCSDAAAGRVLSTWSSNLIELLYAANALLITIWVSRRRSLRNCRWAWSRSSTCEFVCIVPLHGRITCITGRLFLNVARVRLPGPLLLRLALHRGRIWIFDFDPMRQQTVGGHLTGSSLRSQNPNTCDPKILILR
jgi:hypothetical protein